MVVEEKACTEIEDKGIRYVLKSLPALEDTIRLFDRGEYFSAYGSHAIYIAANVFKTTNVLKYMNNDGGQEKIPVCTLGKLQAESFLRDGLVSKQLKFEIWGLSGNAATASSSWKLIRKGSPGNLSEFEDILFHHTAELGSVPVIMAVRIASSQSTGQQQSIVAIAFADATSRMFGYSEFPDNELFSNFESALIQLNVKECIVSDEAISRHPELGKVRLIIERCNVVTTETKKSELICVIR
jgi:DNA mismatch repair protein MSH2